MILIINNSTYTNAVKTLDPATTFFTQKTIVSSRKCKIKKPILVGSIISFKEDVVSTPSMCSKFSEPVMGPRL